ncbi:unnamed protein product, partial [Iphiclides podalirius]
MSLRALSCLATALCLAVAATAGLPRSSNSWQQLVADYARNNMEYGASGPQWTLPGASRPAVAAGADLQPAILPLLVLPMPVQTKDPPRPECPVSSDMSNNQYLNVYENNVKHPRPYPIPTDNNNYKVFDEMYPPKKGQPPRPQNKPTESPSTTPSVDFIPEVDSTPVPPFDKVVSSQQLVELFRAQTPSAPYEPPIKQSAYDGSERAPPPFPTEPLRYRRAYGQQLAAAPGPSANGPPQGSSRSRVPPRPSFDRPLLVRGQLTVPRADYSERYTVWWDPDSGGARVDFHDGSASSFRSLAEGNVYRAESHVDRSGERTVRRCAVGSPQRASAADQALPVLPAELDQFSFAGYVESARGVGELWRRVVGGRAGELGGARGEALTTRHDLLLARDAERVVPLSYTVSVNSSVLGPECDGYHHEFFEVTEQQHMPNLFNLDLDEACDQVEYVNGSSAEQRARLDPLREFTLPRRDPRYDDKLNEFVSEYERSYVDNTEEAVRKNLIMQSHRFVSSGNREGATAELGVNFLCDRLDAELDELRGVEPGAELRRAERFPHSRRQLSAAEDALPKQFDWRPRGGVSPVRYQGSCMSCWAFAVAGAVEGALFVRTRRLVPLSEKCLVDCGHSHGANGCKGTWPSRAYDFIRDRGLPALDEYTPYEPKVDQCAKVSPVTRISGHVNVTQNSVSALKIAIRRHAPTVVIVDAKAKSFITHKKGVLYDDRCGKRRKQLNHAVLAVGWGEKRGEPHFILKNSWSSKWGEGGYVRVQARANTCGVLTMPSYPRLEGEDVLRELPPPPSPSPSDAAADQSDAVRRNRGLATPDYDEEDL